VQDLGLWPYSFSMTGTTNCHCSLDDSCVLGYPRLLDRLSLRLLFCCRRSTFS
jgi:hypothetical protein